MNAIYKGNVPVKVKLITGETKKVQPEQVIELSDYDFQSLSFTGFEKYEEFNITEQVIDDKKKKKRGGR